MFEGLSVEPSGDVVESCGGSNEVHGQSHVEFSRV